MLIFKIFLLVIGLEFQSVKPDFSALNSVSFIGDGVTSVTDGPVSLDGPVYVWSTPRPHFGRTAVLERTQKLRREQPLLQGVTYLPCAQGPPALA